MGVIREELAQVLQQYGDARRTEIVESRVDFCREDLIPEEQVVLTVSQTGYAKNSTTFRLSGTAPWWTW